MIELKSQRTERTATYHLGGDQYQQKCWASDAHYDNWDARGDGEKGWRKCDPVIEANPGVVAEHVDYQQEGWRVLYMPYNAVMPQTADGAFQFRDCRSVPGERKDIRYTITPLDASPVEGEVQGIEVVYRDAFGVGADLVYQLRASGVAKLVRIQPDSVVTGPFRFRVTLPQGAKVLRTNGKDTYELDKRGPKLADSARKTIIEVDGKATYLYPFRWRSGIDAGVLPVLITPDGDDWIFTKEIPAEWARSEPLEVDLTATGSTVTDGYMGHTGAADYATCRDTTTATSISYTDASNLVWGKKGTATRYCYRYVWSVSNTVPSGATVSAVDLYVRCLTNSTPGDGRWVGWTPSDYVSPAATDYAVDPPNTGLGKIGSVDYGATALDTTTTGDKTVRLNATGLAAFTKNGTNGYAVREKPSDYDRNAYSGGAVSPTIAYSEYATSAQRPAQTITYTLPAASGGLMMMGIG